MSGFNSVTAVIKENLIAKTTKLEEKNIASLHIIQCLLAEFLNSSEMKNYGKHFAL